MTGAAMRPPALAVSDLLSSEKINAWAVTSDWWRTKGPRGRWSVVTVPNPSARPISAEHVARIRRAWQEMEAHDV